MLRMVKSINAEAALDMGALVIEGQANIHETVIFEVEERMAEEEKIIIGDRTTIGPFCYIQKGVKIGSKVIMYDSIRIETGCTIGDNCFIGKGVMMRPDTHIGSKCIISHMVMFEGKTEVGTMTQITPQCHITLGANIGSCCFFGPGALSSNDRRIVYMRDKLVAEWSPEGPTIKRAARIGVGAVLLPRVVIGENAIVGGGAVVPSDIPDNKVAVGVPAKVIAEVPEEEKI